MFIVPAPKTRLRFTTISAGPYGDTDYWLRLAEGHLTRRVFAAILRRIWALPLPVG